MQEDKQKVGNKNKKALLIVFISWITIMLAFLIIYASKNYTRTFTVEDNGNTPVARVNGKVIEMNVLSLKMSGMIESRSFGSVDTTSQEVQSKMREAALSNIIDQEILAQKAKEMKLEVTNSQINSELYLIESGYGGREKLAEKLKSIGMSEEDLRNDIEKQLLITALKNKIYDTTKDIVAESDIKIFYEALRDKYIKQNTIPPDLSDIREKIIEKILERRHQQYLEQVAKKLREKANVEVLI